MDSTPLVSTPPIEVVPLQPKEPETLEDFLPLALYFDNDEPDKRTRRTTTKKTYPETFQRYYDRKQHYIDEFTKPLNEDDALDASLEIDNFFEDLWKPICIELVVNIQRNRNIPGIWDYIITHHKIAYEQYVNFK